MVEVDEEEDLNEVPGENADLDLYGDKKGLVQGQAVQEQAGEEDEYGDEEVVPVQAARPFLFGAVDNVKY